GADQPALGREHAEEALVVDVEAEAARRRIEVRAVDEQCDPFLRVEHGQSLPNQYLQAPNIRLCISGEGLRPVKTRRAHILACAMILLGIGGNLASAEFGAPPR